MPIGLVTKLETPCTHLLVETLGRIFGGPMALALFILFASCGWVIADAQSQESNLSKNSAGIPDGDATRKVFDRQLFPWYDSLKQEFVPILEKTPPEAPAVPPELAGGSLFSPGPVFFGIVLAIIVIGLIVFLIRFDWSGLKNDQLPESKTTVDIETEKIAALPLAVRGKGDLLSKAEQFASVGQLGDAITYYHSWQLLRLDKAGHIELQSGKTNRSYLGELSGAPTELRETFRQSTRLFEDAFYGGLTIDEVAFDAVWNNRSQFESPIPFKSPGPVLKGNK